MTATTAECPARAAAGPEKNPPRTRPGTRVVVEAFRAEGVDLVFGYQGGQIIPLFDALADCPDIRVVMTRHEQAAAHAADGYARVSGRVGVCISTSGPGATNLVTGIANAYMDSIPMVAISGQVRSDLIGNDAFQEVDVVGITRSIVKHNYLVNHPEELPRIMREAFHIARSGRPGPVVIDLPVDTLRAEIAAPLPDAVDIPSYQPQKIARANPGQIKRAAERLNQSERPLFYVGGGVVSSPWQGRIGPAPVPAPGSGSGPDADAGAGAPDPRPRGNASELLRAVAEAGNIPVTTTLMALGAFPNRHPLSLHMLGMHGTAYANQAVQHCDCLVALGARFDDRITGRVSAFAPKAEIIQIDIDPTSVGKNVRVDIPVIGEVGQALELLGERLDPERAKSPARLAWLRQIAEWKQRLALAYSPSNGMVRPQAVIEAINEALAERGGDSVVCTEVGQHQMWAALYGHFERPRRWVSSGGLGTMGFGLPAAIGAQFALPEATVVDISGDGSLQMNIQEFATLASRGLPVKIVVLDNGFLGMVRQWQELFHNRRYMITDLSDNPDFVKVAEAFGLSAWRVTEPSALGPTLREAFAHPGPALVDVLVEREENVYPMVPAGEALDRMILGDV